MGIDGGTGAEFYGATYSDLGVVVGGDGGIASALGKTERGKSACGLKKTTTEPERDTTGQLNKDRVGYPAPRLRQGARPARQVSAQRINRKRRRACLLAAASRKRKTPAEAIAGRGGNEYGEKTRCALALRKVTAGRATKQGRLTKGARRPPLTSCEVREPLGGSGGDKKAPSERGATKAVGLGDANARWSRASGA